MIFDWFHSLFSNDMGIDLGTANTLVYVKGQGIVLSEPSVVAIQASTGKVLAVGQEAKRMLGRTPGEIVAIRPMKDGVIADFETVEKMIRYFINKVHNRATLVKPRIVIGVPSGITEVERRAVRESAEQAGARDIFLIDEAFAAALGAKIPVHEPAGNMIIDIGGGTTEIAVISLGGMVIADSIRIGGDEFDEAIIKHLRLHHNLIIGERTAEEIKLAIGNAMPEKKTETFELKGRDAGTGLPRTVVIDSAEVRKALKEPIDAIVEATKIALEKTPPELAADIVERGIVMTGGGCLLKGLDKHISKETGVPVIRAENPLNCVVEGTGKYLEELKYLKGR
ncbi:MAG TPA: rod shape-determining protein [Turneriella sp.]|jgi:rod shape-determining protein MreB|nr:rod shape-determining protein [Turneriella sp.]HNA79013.1 rod shape-determining protein [Turneriella sp.]HNJ65731.1 rod shape-determining protein [Turneriella sp.]HNL09642.1 rod shape-determining protein [Turneriella sp.]HNL52800.1 rod shape-determining protein [Turneriella sp.]